MADFCSVRRTFATTPVAKLVPLLAMVLAAAARGEQRQLPEANPQMPPALSGQPDVPSFDKKRGQVPPVPRPTLTRWAIVAAGPVQESGLAELLTVELSKLDGIDLVEREQLGTVLKELQLVALGEAGGVAERLKLGRLLKADALAVLSEETRGRIRSIRLVISDCRYGGRLQVEHYSYAAGSQETLARQMGAAIEAVRHRFASGMKQMIAIPPMVSKNLTHDFDHLQMGFKHLLENALLQVPGVAVMELEEARAIGREVEIGGVALENRIVPMIVEGEFEMAPSAPEDDPTLRLCVTVRDGQQNIARWETPAIRLSQAVERLGSKVAGSVVKLAGQQPVGMSREQQITALQERAEALARVGAWDLSLPLHEAALLIDPNNVDQRLWALADRGRVDSRGEWVLRYVEPLLRSRAVNRNEAVILLAVIHRKLLYSGKDPQERMRQFRQSFWQLSKLAVKLPHQLGETRKSIEEIASVYLRVGYAGSPSPKAQDSELMRSILQHLMALAKPNYRDALDQVYELLDAIEPFSPLELVRDVLNRDVLQYVHETQIPFDDARRLLAKLADSPKPSYSVCAQLALIQLDIRQQTPGPFEPQLLTRLDEFSAKINQYDRAKLSQESVELLLDDVEVARKEIHARLPDPRGIVKKRHQPPGNPINEFGEPDTSGRVVFEPLTDLKIDFDNQIQCAEDMDVWYSQRAVHVMRQPGVAQQIYTPHKLEEGVAGVRFDGENLWVATLLSEILIISPEGQVLTRINQKDGLPPYHTLRGETVEQGGSSMVLLHPIEPGKCFAVGSFGEHQRVWFAVLSQTVDPKVSPSSRVHVFHKFTEVGLPNVLGSHESVDQIFVPGPLKEYRGEGQSPRRLVLVTRMVDATGFHPLLWNPLAVDLSTLAVTVFPVRVPSVQALVSGKESYCSGGALLVAGGQEVHKIVADDQAKEGWSSTVLKSSKPLPPAGSAFQPANGSSYGTRPFLLPFKGMVYAPGVFWQRIDPAVWKVELLTTGKLPPDLVFPWYGVSAHYGLIARGQKGPAYRIYIDPPPEKAALWPTEFYFVPPERRARHVRAVQAIRNLGGEVGLVSLATYSIDDITVLGRGEGIIVYLSEKWQGGDQGLEHLRDIDRLHSLYLVRANVSNDGMAAIGRLTELRALRLVETKVTDAGLSHLKDLGHLAHLHLEGLAGGHEFTDASLASCVDLPLKQLVLYGSGYTEASLERLRPMRQLKQAILLDTAVPRKAIDEMRKSRPGFGVLAR